MRRDITVTVNGKVYQETVEHRLLLSDFLRETLGLTGTHVGCGHEGRCGVCTVVYEGVAIKSCLMLAVQADGARLLTIEGLAQGEQMHPLQEAMRDKHGLQCGYCTPGMIMASLDLLNENPDPTADEVRHGLEGNLCRCTGYQNIVKAVRSAAVAIRQGASEPARSAEGVPA
jgi:aerobic carbon-monoxide dehydrogenase small subunit